MCLNITKWNPYGRFAAVVGQVQRFAAVGLKVGGDVEQHFRNFFSSIFLFCVFEKWCDCRRGHNFILLMNGLQWRSGGRQEGLPPDLVKEDDLKYIGPSHRACQAW